MTLNKKILTTILIILVAGCSSTYKAKVNFDKNSKIDTSRYKTFAWLNSGKIMVPSPGINPVMKLRVDEEIERAFIAIGYQLIDDAELADFAISYTVGNRDKIKVSHYPTTYNTSFGWGLGYYGGVFGGIHNNTEIRVRQYTQGKLAIDVYDVKSHQPAWHGWAVKRVSYNDEETPLSAYKDIINKVVSQFN